MGPNFKVPIRRVRASLFSCASYHKEMPKFEHGETKKPRRADPPSNHNVGRVDKSEVYELTEL
jgi:hypothetical protein